MKSWSNYSHNCIWPILPNVKKLLFTTNQRNRGSFRLWGTSGNLWFNLQLTAGTALRSDQAAQVFIYSGIGNLQGQKLHNLLGQPMPLPDCVHGKTTLLTSAATLSISIHVSCLLTFYQCDEPNSVLCVSSLQALQLLLGTSKVISAPKWAYPAPPISPHSTNAPAPTPVVVSAEQSPIPWCLPCTVGWQVDVLCRYAAVSVEQRK